MSAKEYSTLLQNGPVATEQTTRRYRRQPAEMALAVLQAKVLICDPISAVAVARLRDSGLQVDERVGLSAEALEALIGGYDAIVVRSATRLTAKQIAAANRLRLIVRGGIGTDNIDLDAAAKRHIPVFNTPKASTASVAELALGQLLALARRTPQADAALKAGKWPKREFSDGVELKDKTLGIIGVGRIGGTLGRYALALGMRIIGTDTNTMPAGSFDGLELVPLAALLARADCISVHTPSLDGQPVIGRQEIAQMKDGALLINCARGGLIDEAALLEALESGKLRGAALDVFSEEPPQEQRLIHHPQVICTPHLGGATREAQARIGMEVVRILLDEL
ncbi:hydroxyacid dehydrogenase [Vogesella facilis]|uniref:Hydroxyacid dehydrogenase n=1 Tax=Vogesella facilis TaxID=1655232 RepID=A0ABV7RA81_9NEIS